VKDNNVMDFQEAGYEGMDCIILSQDRDRWRTLVKAVKKFGLHELWGISEELLASQQPFCSMELVS